MSVLTVCCDAEARVDHARALAERLHTRLQDCSEIACGEAALVVTPERVELRIFGPQAPGAVYADFAEGRARHRRVYGGGRGQPLARAAGLRPGERCRVVDATAGLGRDAFVLASLGCEVTLVERSAPIAALLEDGLERARADAEIGIWVSSRMRLVHSDAVRWLDALPDDQAPDVVYLDPMYPHRQKSALVKKEMRLFQSLIGADEDSCALLAAALRKARRRVVVKRPKGAPSLEGPSPNTRIESKNTRYDVYVIGALSGKKVAPAD